MNKISPECTHYDRSSIYPSQLLLKNVSLKTNPSWSNARKMIDQGNYNPNITTGGGRIYYEHQLKKDVEKGNYDYQTKIVKGKNSSVYLGDNITGRTVFTKSGRPIRLQKNDLPEIPQVKYSDGIDRFLPWERSDYTEVDHQANYNHAMKSFKNNCDLPLIDDIKQEKTKSCEHHYLPINEDSRLNRQSDKTFYPHQDYQSESRQIGVQSLNVKPEEKTSFETYGPVEMFSALTNNVNKLIFANNRLKTTIKEHYIPTDDREMRHTDELYKNILRAYPKAICYYVNHCKYYRHWIKNWEILDHNLLKTDLNVGRLEVGDEDVAYTENKGEIIKFRWRDKKQWMPLNVFVYVLLHELTHQIFPPSFQGHDSPFPEMLCLMCVVGYELRLFDLECIPKDMFYSNGQPITCRNSIKRELNFGIDMLEKVNNTEDDYKYYEALRKNINDK